MDCIINASSDILGILGKPKLSDEKLRLMKYCVSVRTDEGVLLFNTLTREMVLLTFEEHEAAFASDYLREHWFTVPETTNEKELAELVRWVQTSVRKKPEHIVNYTIFTTTDCNARCFYCYEHGCARVSMTMETADNIVAYIKENCGGEKASITWFGGEPLMNYPVIDRICEGLRREGVEFKSNMISNAYLFSDELAERAAESWNLKKIQITLDGTEEVYNRSKAYIYRDGSAYQVVNGNIQRLLNAGVYVVIRLNMDLNNADDLMKLVNELAARFEGQKRLRIYASLLFDIEKKADERYTPEEWTRLYAALGRLEDTLMTRGLIPDGNIRLNRELPLNHCMADDGRSVIIAPDGHLGLCEHYPDREFFGHIDSPERDEEMINSWQKRCDPISECDDCFRYPECVVLKKCSGRMECSRHELNARRRRTEQSMLNEYRIWREKMRHENGEQTEKPL